MNKDNLAYLHLMLDAFIKIEKFINLYDGVGVDPRGHVVTVAYLCSVIWGELKPLDNESSDVKFFDIHSLPKDIGFDHRDVIKEGFRVLYGKI